jgi:FKBP-type peptidyl-prolyl cis-trans isomerase SlyD
MDFNHPLAGDNLYFSGKVVEIRDATDEEIQHGHIHSSTSCGDDCGGGCGSQKSGCNC